MLHKNIFQVTQARTIYTVYNTILKRHQLDGESEYLKKMSEIPNQKWVFSRCVVDLEAHYMKTPEKVRI